MHIRAQWIISEKGLQSLNAAGITTGWLKAWLCSAGATEVDVHLLHSDGWSSKPAEWQLFFADEGELVQAARNLGISLQQSGGAVPEGFRSAHLLMNNPHRICWIYQSDQRAMLFLSPGDIAYQRQHYLMQLNGGVPLMPLYVLPDERGELPLEPGLSASLSAADSENRVNAAGLLPEEQVIALLRQRGLSLRTAESCTGGAIASRLCRMPGASDVVDRAWVTYSNDAKTEEVAVPAALIERHGAVSEQVVRAMAEGGADERCICIAVSGIAGPGGAVPGKPPGTVWIAVALRGQNTISQCLHLTGARHEIQAKAVPGALHLLLEAVEK